MDSTQTLVYQPPSTSYSDGFNQTHYSPEVPGRSRIMQRFNNGDADMSTHSSKRRQFEPTYRSSSSTLFFHPHSHRGSPLTPPLESPAPTSTKTMEYFPLQPSPPMLSREEPTSFPSVTTGSSPELGYGTVGEMTLASETTQSSGLPISTHDSSSSSSSSSPSSSSRPWSPPSAAGPALRRSVSNACPRRRPLDAHRHMPRAVTPDTASTTASTTSSKRRERLYSPMAAGFARLAGQKHRETIAAVVAGSTSSPSTLSTAQATPTAGSPLRRSSIPMSSSVSTMGVTLALKQHQWQQQHPDYQQRPQRLSESMALVARMFDGPA